MRKVQPGDPLRIPAATYNAFVDAARAHQANRLGGQAGQAWRQTGIVLIRNDSGGTVPRFGVLAITGPAIDPSDNECAFASRVAVAGNTPTAADAGRFVVLLEPAKSGAFVRSCVAGVTLARVEMAGEEHAYADIKPDYADVLLSGAAGLAQLLWVQPEAQRDPPGIAWAIVRLGGGGGTLAGGFALVTAKVGSQAPYRYACVEAEMDIDGVFTEKVDGTLYANVYILDEQGSGGQGAAPVVIGDAILILPAPAGINAYVGIRGHYRGTY